MSIGVLGFGSMGKTYAFTIHNLNYFYKDLPFRATLGGIYTRTQKAREEAAQKYGFAKVYSSEDGVRL